MDPSKRTKCPLPKEQKGCEGCVVKTTRAEVNNYLEMKLDQFSVMQEMKRFPKKGFVVKIPSEIQQSTEL